MNIEEAYEIEEIFNDLEKYQYPIIKAKVARVREVIQPIIDNERLKEFKHVRNLKWSWGNFNPFKSTMRATELLSVPTLYEEAEKEIEHYARETQDILHALELEVLSEEEEREIINKLKQIRQYRRKAKDFITVSKPLYEFVQANRTLLKKLGPIQNEINVMMNKLDNRTYTPREITSLEEAFQKATINQ